MRSLFIYALSIFASQFLTFSVHADSQTLHEAIMIEDFKAVKLAIEQGASVNTDCDMPTICSPLLGAIETSQPKVIKLLIQHKVDLNVDAGLGFRALDRAFSRYYDADEDSYRERARKVMRRMIKGGADIHYTNDYGKTPLITAAEKGDAETITLLLKHQADVNQPAGGMGMFGATALMVAAKAGHKDAISELLDHGANKAWKDELGRTASDYAQNSGHTDIAKMLTP